MFATSRYNGVVGVLRHPLKDGTQENMLVNGSATPKVYRMTADPVKDCRMYELRFTFSAAFITTDGSRFGSVAILPNGLLVEMVIDGQIHEMGNVKITEDFFTLVSGSMPVILQGPKDVLITGVEFENALHSAPGIVLKAGSSDEIRVTVRDDLTHPNLKLLRALVFCTEE